MKLGETTEDRLSGGDLWQNRYCWPDPDDGWSGALAGYPPDHPIRKGRPIPLSLVAKRYQDDLRVTRYRRYFTGWPATETPAPATKSPSDATESATKRPATKSPGADATETPSDQLGDVFEAALVKAKIGRPLSEDTMSSTERSRLSRERKRKAQEDRG